MKYYILADYTKATIEVFELTDNQYRSVEKNNFALNTNSLVTFHFHEFIKDASLLPSIKNSPSPITGEGEFDL